MTLFVAQNTNEKRLKLDFLVSVQVHIATPFKAKHALSRYEGLKQYPIRENSGKLVNKNAIKTNRLYPI